MSYRIETFTKITGDKPEENCLAKIEVLGTGGAFDHEEGNSSFLLQAYTESGDWNLLIDCGESVYTKLKEQDIVDQIDEVLITHSHSDHIGSLSTLIYDRWFVHQRPTRIVCSEKVGKVLFMYLTQVCGHEEEEFSIVHSLGYIELHIIDTEGCHSPNYRKNQIPTSGFIFKLDDFYFVLSGDINTPFIDVLKKNYADLYNQLLIGRDNVLFLHDSAASDYGEHNAHTPYFRLAETINKFRNLYTYHHSHEQALQMPEHLGRSLTLNKIKEFQINKQ